MAKMPAQMAQHTVENYCCSKCWGSLIKEYVIGPDSQIEKSPEGESLSFVKCRLCDADLGFVSLHFIEKERLRDFGDAYEVKKDLSIMGLVPKEKQHANQECYQ